MFFRHDPSPKIRSYFPDPPEPASGEATQAVSPGSEPVRAGKPATGPESQPMRAGKPAAGPGSQPVRPPRKQPPQPAPSALPIPDYREYHLSRREKLRFTIAGYFFIAGIVFLFYRSILLAALAGLLIRKGQGLYEKYLARKRLEQLNIQFRDLLDSLSASVMAGRQMPEALVGACDDLARIHPPDAPIMQELQFMRRSILDRRESDRSLLSSFARRTGSEDIRSFVEVYLTCRSTGGDLERIISHSARIITEKMKISEQIRTITAQKKMEGRLICLMPAVMLLGLNLLSPSYINILYTCLAGRLIMTFCLAATAAGAWLMERMADVQV